MVPVTLQCHWGPISTVPDLAISSLAVVSTHFAHLQRAGQAELA